MTPSGLLVFRTLIPALVFMVAPRAACGSDIIITREIESGAHTLAGSILAGGQSFALLTELADGIGPRLTGSDNYSQAVAWAVDQFHSFGITNVRQEPITLPHGWQRGTALASMLTPYHRLLHVAAYGWSPPTASGGLRARVVPISAITDEAIAAAGVRGAIVLVDRAALTGASPFEHNTAEDFARDRLYETLDRRLAAAGAAAALIYAKAVNQVLRTSDPESGARPLALPMGSIGREDALFILRHQEREAPTLELKLNTVLTGPTTVASVVGEITGREQPGEVVMLGAHLDSWDLATGAQDNGSGVAQVLEVARAIAQLPDKPRRSIRFALWAAEEEGSIGSIAYVRTHAAELPHFIAYLNTDTGAGRPLGYLADGRTDIAPALAALTPLLRTIGGTEVSEDVTFDTDSAPFFAAGVAALDLKVVDSEYDSIVHHKPADTLDKVDAQDLAAGAAMLAVTAYALAETPKRAFSRLTREDLRALLKRTGAVEYFTGSDFSDLYRD